MKTAFGAFVREKRLDKNIGLNNFAKMVGVSAPFISKMEVGDWNAPSEATIIKIAEKLDINIDCLLALAGKISTENKQKMMDKIIEENKPIKVFTNAQKIAFDKLKVRINDIGCSHCYQCPFNFFESDMNGNLKLYNSLTIESIDKDYILNRLRRTKEHLMVYDSKIKNKDETFEYAVYMNPLPCGTVVTESRFSKKKNVVMYGFRHIAEAEICLNVI